MFLIAGLGNPGRKYEGTKHNMGFDVVTKLIDKWNIPYSGISMKAMYGKGRIAGEKAILLKPMTYMNLSGDAVGAFVRYYRIDPESELLVIYDDISLAPGQLRIRAKGSAGGHNGMKSIIEALGTDRFARIRVGIGEKPPGWDLADYVLAPFAAEDRQKVDRAIDAAAEAAARILAGDLDGAMSFYNRKQEDE